ncbi:PIR Superfamily Protein [Plasmodium ovale wallikeri]|uniref:PIR Superfamily Protein n=1 Tax=Plasmodium ovale wallikeri TaxID=864142 RepID=A0A1A9ALQ1_PLAOA|nr:PIR Superfamily Protein [Plasmodium ovale wallikeri]SBT58462.1 PIR Superfamily Protein [Plasmodium ovale wallikeri]
MTLGEGDLPAKDFDVKWKKDTNFSEFEDAVNSEDKINDMKNWIIRFDGKLLDIYKESSTAEFIHIQDKRCRDLNYYINYMLHHIPIITNQTEDATEIKEKFQRFVQAIFTGWIKFKCTHVQKDYTPTMFLIKELDDYCENKNAFKTKLNKYDKITCCKYANHVNETRRSFNKYILNGIVNKDDRNFHIDDKCTLKNSGETFPNVICNEKYISVSKSDELPIPLVNGYLPNYQQHMLRGTLPEDSFNSSPTKIALTSVSTILGACISGLYLYRHSFIGSMLRNFQNRNHISNEDTYNDVNEMFSEGTSHYLDNLQENDRFHIAYDPINN